MTWSLTWPAARVFESIREPDRGCRPACDLSLPNSARRNSELRRLWLAVPGGPLSRAERVPAAPRGDYPRSALPTARARTLLRQELRHP
jgi:hypothetical protein